mmetsp:Transcript_82763/g.159930  ORF Transcript_82763/g.159930 Transcript_82763/m.159930 type:complete len:317 (+) Transcript_82763:1419-2369(+)
MRIMSAAFFVTAVPEMPIATPISAPFSAGASLTPSPVIAETWPCTTRLSTIATLSEGCARDQITHCDVMDTISSLPLKGLICWSFPAPSCTESWRFNFREEEEFRSREAVRARCSASSCKSVQRRATSSSLEPSWMMPTCLPMAMAVGLWSPVIMMTLMPASWHFRILGGTLDLGGSKIPHKPSRARGPGAKKSAKRSSAVSMPRSFSTSAAVRGRTASNKLRRACRASSSLLSAASCRSSSVMPPSATARAPATVDSTAPSFGKSLSGAPFSSTQCVCSTLNFSVARVWLSGDSWQTTALIFLDDEKGTSSLGSS